ncbi:MAG: DOMON domain-containing protein [Planctomycetota bacterium]|jgi:hypothetical protein
MVAPFGREGKSLKITSYTGKQAETAWRSASFPLSGKALQVSCWFADNYMWIGGGGRDESFLATVELEWFDKAGKPLGLTWYLLPSSYRPIAEEDGPWIEPQGLLWTFKQAVVTPPAAAASARLLFHFPEGKDPTGSIYLDEVLVKEGNFKAQEKVATTDGATPAWNDHMLVNTPAPFNLFMQHNPLQFDIAFWGRTAKGEPARMAQIPADAVLAWEVTNFLEEILANGTFPLAGRLKPLKINGRFNRSPFNKGKLETAQLLLDPAFKKRIGEQLFLEVSLLSKGKVLKRDTITFLVTDPKPARTKEQIRNAHFECASWGRPNPWGSLEPWGSKTEPMGISERIGMNVYYKAEWDLNKWTDPAVDPATLVKAKPTQYKGIRLAHWYAQDWQNRIGTTREKPRRQAYPQWMLKPWTGDVAKMDLYPKHRANTVDLKAFGRWIQGCMKQYGQHHTVLSVDPAGMERTYDDFSHQMQVAGYKAIKAADPKMPVVLSFYGGYFNRAGEYFKKGAMDYCDILDDHIYTDAASVRGRCKTIADLYKRLKKEGRPKKFITTEMAAVGSLDQTAKAVDQIAMVTDLMAHHLTFFNCFYTGEVAGKTRKAALRNWPKTGDQGEQYLFMDPLIGHKISPDLQRVIPYREMPLLRLGAFYNLQRFIGWADFKKKVGPEPKTHAYLFEQEGRSTMTAYRVAPTGTGYYLLKAPGATAVTLVDVYGRARRVAIDGQKGLAIAIHETPAFWDFEGTLSDLSLTPLPIDFGTDVSLVAGGSARIHFACKADTAAWQGATGELLVGRPFTPLAPLKTTTTAKKAELGWALKVPEVAPPLFAPVLTVEKGGRCLALIDAFWKLRDPVQIRVTTVPEVPGTQARLVMTVENKGRTPWTGAVSVSNPYFGAAKDHPVGFHHSFQVAPGTTRAQSFPIEMPGGLKNNLIYPVTVKVTSPGVEAREWAQTLSFISCRRRTAPITIDGDLKDWKLSELKPVEFVRTIYFNNRGRKDYIPGSKKDQQFEWKGTTDATARMYTRWDEGHVYVAYEVHDDRWVNDGKGVHIYDGDTLMENILCGTVEPGKGVSMMPVRSHLGLNRDKESVALRCDLGSPGLAKPEGVEFKMTVKGSTHIYEIKYPIASLAPLQTGLGQRFRMSGWLFDDDIPNKAGLRGLALFSYVSNMDRNPKYWADWVMTD